MKTANFYPIWARQGIGLIREVRPAGQVLQEVMRGAEAALSALNALTGPS